MATMTAAFFNGKGQMELHDHPKPNAGPGEAVIRLRATGICGSDLQMNADKDAPDKLPEGHEVAGEVVEIGEGVDPSLMGQRVTIDIIGSGRACTTCWYCRQGEFTYCENKAPTEGGGFADYMKRQAMGCYPVPDSLSWEEAALVEPLAVSVHGVRRGVLSGGETVAVLGSGNIGLTAIAAARAMGAGKIFATARYEQQARLAKALGADEALPDTGPEFKEAIKEVTEGRGADMTIETVGGNQDKTAAQAVDVTRRQGRIVVLGVYRRPFEFNFLRPGFREQSIIFSNCYSVIDGRHDYEVAIDMIASGRTSIEQMVTHKYPLDQIQPAFETASDKNSGAVKVQIRQD